MNNAGITVDKSVLKMTPHDWNGILIVNLSGTFYLSKVVRQPMLGRGSGRIDNISSSIVGQTGDIGQANYPAAKSGLFGLTMSVARGGPASAQGRQAGRRRTGPDGERFGARLPRHRDGRCCAERILDWIAAQIPVRRLGRPQEVARIRSFLCDDASSYITRQVWGINGGMDR